MKMTEEHKNFISHFCLPKSAEEMDENKQLSKEEGLLIIKEISSAIKARKKRKTLNSAI